jgi:hypothetical protein
MSELSTPKRQRVSWSADERADWVRMFEASGISLSDFCRENDLPDATLSLWRRQLRGPDVSVESGALVEIPTTPVKNLSAGKDIVADSPALRVRLRGGIELDVVSGTDARWLAGVVRALQPAAD